MYIFFLFIHILALNNPSIRSIRCQTMLVCPYVWRMNREHLTGPETKTLSTHMYTHTNILSSLSVCTCHKLLASGCDHCTNYCISRELHVLIHVVLILLLSSLLSAPFFLIKPHCLLSVRWVCCWLWKSIKARQDKIHITVPGGINMFFGPMSFDPALLYSDALWPHQWKVVCLVVFAQTALGQLFVPSVHDAHALHLLFLTLWGCGVFFFPQRCVLL